jgi:peptidoglycan/LPS O-acetylase OafA/YrhL
MGKSRVYQQGRAHSGIVKEMGTVEQSTSMQEVAIDHGVQPKRVAHGLDTLRFISAMWVAFYHGARFPVDRFIEPTSAFNKFLLLVGNTTWNGTAAVVVFFVISGFLIHGGNVGKQKVDLPSFWMRRGIRIIVPLTVTVLIAYALGASYVRVLDAILWTVYAEISYYLLYPLLLPFITKFGIGRILLISLAISLAMIASRPTEIYLFAFGIKLTWLFNAPLWLMGCYLAERREQIGALSAKFPLWGLRCVSLIYCYASTILANHAGNVAIGYTWTIWIFGAHCMVWLDAEMRRGTGKSTLHMFEKFGLAGYSLYLTHKIPINFVDTELSQLEPVTSWLVKLIAIAAIAWIFYRLVEWPAHKAARSFGRNNRPKAAVVET